MYNIKCNMPVNREPWNIPLEERVRALLSAAHSGKKVALMMYQQADTSTFRYRCYNVYQITQNGEWQSVFFS